MEARRTRKHAWLTLCEMWPRVRESRSGTVPDGFRNALAETQAIDKSAHGLPHSDKNAFRGLHLKVNTFGNSHKRNLIGIIPTPMKLRIDNLCLNWPRFVHLHNSSFEHTQFYIEFLY